MGLFVGDAFSARRHLNVIGLVFFSRPIIITRDVAKRAKAFYAGENINLTTRRTIVERARFNRHDHDNDNNNDGGISLRDE